MSKKISSYWLLIIAILLLTAITISYYVITGFHLESYKPYIEQKASQAMGRKITLNGPIHIKLGWQPIIRIEKITIANAPWSKGTNAATINQVVLQLDFRSILHRKIYLTHVTINGATIKLEKNKQGQYNWPFEKIETLIKSAPTFMLPFNIKIAADDIAITLKQPIGLEHEIVVQHADTQFNDINKFLAIAASGTAKKIPFKAKVLVNYPENIADGPYQLKLTINGISTEFII